MRPLVRGISIRICLRTVLVGLPEANVLVAPFSVFAHTLRDKPYSHRNLPDASGPTDKRGIWRSATGHPVDESETRQCKRMRSYGRNDDDHRADYVPADGEGFEQQTLAKLITDVISSDFDFCGCEQHDVGNKSSALRT